MDADSVLVTFVAGSGTAAAEECGTSLQKLGAACICAAARPWRGGRWMMIGSWRLLQISKYLLSTNTAPSIISADQDTGWPWVQCPRSSLLHSRSWSRTNHWSPLINYLLAPLARPRHLDTSHNGMDLSFCRPSGLLCCLQLKSGFKGEGSM